jgi:hypothetical protein
VQCSAEAIAPCAPLIADDRTQCGALPADAGCAAAVLKADAVNRGRHIECQRKQRAAADCLRTLQNSGVLKPAPTEPPP